MLCPGGHELSLHGTARGGRVARSLSAIRQAATNLPRNDWMTTARILALVLVAPQACHSGEHASSASRLRTRVVDSVRGRAWWSNDDSMFTYLVEIHATNSADTVRGVVPPMPTIVGDTQVIGLRVDTAKYDRAIFTLLTLWLPDWKSASPIPGLGISVPQLGCFLAFWLLNMLVVWKGIESIRLLLCQPIVRNSRLQPAH